MKNRIMVLRDLCNYKTLLKKMSSREVAAYKWLTLFWNGGIIYFLICLAFMKPVLGLLVLTLTVISDIGYTTYIILRKPKFD